MKWFLSIIPFLISIQNFSQETKRIFFRDMDDYIERGKYKSFAFKMYSLKNDSTFILKNHQGTLKKSSARIYLQHENFDITKPPF